MNDEAFLTAVAAGDEPDGHEANVRLAWLLARVMPLAQATAAMNAAIDRRARPRGGRVDVDLTARWMQRIAAALAGDGGLAGDSFDAFCRRHPHLLRRRDPQAA